MKTTNTLIKTALLSGLMFSLPIYSMMQKAEQKLARPAVSVLERCTQRFFANPAAQNVCRMTTLGALQQARNLSSSTPSLYERYTAKSTEDLSLNLKDLADLKSKKPSLSKEAYDKELKRIEEKYSLRKKITSLEADYEELSNQQTPWSEELKKTLLDNLKEQDKTKRALWNIEFKEEREKIGKTFKTPQSEKLPKIIEKLPEYKK